jgi:uncharacterized protein (DUF1330 family)
MAKAYMVTVYRAVRDPAKLAAYAELAGPAVAAGGGRFVARGMPVKTYENGLSERTVVVEFPSVAAARAMYEGPQYRKALDALGDGADRDMRLVEAAEQ